jgi:hypothetical protein
MSQEKHSPPSALPTSHKRMLSPALTIPLAVSGALSLFLLFLILEEPSFLEIEHLLLVGIPACMLALIFIPIAIGKLVTSSNLRSWKNFLLLTIATLAALPALLFTEYIGSTVMPISAAERRAIATAEAYVARHGYTAAGHPPDLPVLQTDIWDRLLGSEGATAARRDRLQAKAFGVARDWPLSYRVLFEGADSPTAGNCYQIVQIDAGGRANMAHSPYCFQEWGYKLNLPQV